MEENKLVNGNIKVELIKLVIPMMLGNFLNLAYNIVDTIWIGQIVGSAGLGAIAVSFPIIFILISIASGVSVASNVLVAQYYGAKNFEKISHISKISSNVSFFLSIFLAVLGYITAPYLMKFLNTADSIMEYSLSYFRISMIGFPFVFYYFLTSSLLRAIGDTVRPLIFLAISSIINVILDPIMIKGLWIFPEMGLNGAAYATIISQFISLLVCIIYLKFKNIYITINPFYFIFDAKIIGLIFKIGLPFSTTQLIISFSWLLLNRLINSYGEEASAAIAIFIRIDSLSFLPLVALSAGIATIAAQNIGANKMERVKEVYNFGSIIGIFISTIMALIAILFPDLIIKMFTKDIEVINHTKGYLFIVMPSLIFLSVMFSTNGVINGAGKTLITMIFTFITHLAIRVPLAYIFSEKIDLFGVWTGMAFGNILAMILSLTYYLSGKWKHSSNITLEN